MNPFIVALQVFGVAAAVLVAAIGVTFPFLLGRVNAGAVEKLGLWTYLVWVVTSYLGVVAAVALIQLVLQV